MKRKSFKRLLLISTVSILTLIFSSALLNAQKKVSEKEKYGGTLTIAVLNDARSLDPRYLVSVSTETSGFERIYDRLVDYPKVGVIEIIPSLVTSWKQVDDVTWLVSLRKGVKFHNGKELTAEDIRKNIDWKMNSRKYLQEKGWKPPRVQTYAQQINTIEILDNYTMRFILKKPFGAFPEVVLSDAVYGIIDPDIVEKYGREATLHPVGTGPFKFVERVTGDRIVLERFDEYWGGKAYLDRVIFRVIPDPQTRVIALQTGEVDIARELPLTCLPVLKKDPRLGYFLTSESKNIEGTLDFNLRRWPVNQLKFRQAVAMGVDWKKIGVASFPKGFPASQFIMRSWLKGSWAENPEAEKLLPSYNPQRARELLKEVEKEAGRPLPKGIDSLVSRYSIMNETLKMAAEGLKKIGLNLQIRSLEEITRADIVRRDPKASWEIGFGSMGGTGSDPSRWSLAFNSKSRRSGDGRNTYAYENPEVDKLADKADAISDRQERKKLYQQMEKIVLKDLPVMPMFNVPKLLGYNKRVHDLINHDSLTLYLKSTWNNVWIEK